METMWVHQMVLTSEESESDVSAWCFRQIQLELDLKRTLFHSCALCRCSSSRTDLHSSGLCPPPPLHQRKLSPPLLSADIPHLQTEKKLILNLVTCGRCYAGIQLLTCFTTWISTQFQLLMGGVRQTGAMGSEGGKGGEDSQTFKNCMRSG